MKKYIYLLLLSFFTFHFSPLMVWGQDHDFEALKKEYPLLMERYGDRLESRNAHYIFAIDISSSMQKYEKVVRENLKTFVKAIPDNDQVTIIVVCDENNTNYLNSIKCITLNPAVRQSIINAMDSPQFRFLRRHDPKDGSDGFTMAQKVLDAMNVVNSSDLTFVYLLTDFEYWTHKNHFDKTKEDWASLKPQLTSKHEGAMCKYGVELNLGAVSHQEAVIKPELEAIFGAIEYEPANDAVILEQWFGHIIDNIRAQKIYSMLKADWQEWLDKKENKAICRDRYVEMVITHTDTDLVSGFTADTLLTLTQAPTWYPSFVHVDSADLHVRVTYASKYAEEIDKLEGLCKVNPNNPDAVNLTREEKVKLPALGIWNSTLPQWLWYSIIGLIILFILSVIWKYMQKPKKRYTSVVVKRKTSEGTKQYNGDADALPFSIGQDGELNVPGASWRIKIVAKRYNPIFNPIRKTGYYAVLEVGDFADIVNEMTDMKVATLQLGRTAFLFKYKKAPMVRIEITEGITTNIITLS